MARQLRIEYPGATYHVMSRGVARMNTFVDDRDRMRLLELVGEAAKDGALIVHAYCLMPNHYHLLAEIPEAQLGRWMQRILGVYAGGFNRRHKRVGHLWQGRYKAILVEDGEYFLECSRYIHLNPNRSGMTRSAQLYPWSSYRNYIGGQTEVDWVATERTLSHFDTRTDYRDFVESGRGEEPISPFFRAKVGLVLGSEAFFEKIRILALSQEGRTRYRDSELAPIAARTSTERGCGPRSRLSNLL